MLWISLCPQTSCWKRGLQGLVEVESKAGSLGFWSCEEEPVALSLQLRVSQVKEAHVLRAVV